jgi:hypothetical protein
MMSVYINGFRARSTSDIVMLATSFLLLLLLLRVPYKLVSIGARTITKRTFIILVAVFAQRHGALFLAGLNLVVD